MTPLTLSPRELAILRLVAEGHTGLEIAHRLGISIRTEKNHRHAAFVKLGAVSVAHMIALMDDLLPDWREPLGTDPTPILRALRKEIAALLEAQQGIPLVLAVDSGAGEAHDGGARE